MQSDPTGRCPGHQWYENGQSAYTGAALRLFQRLDGLFLSWAAELSAEDHQFPTFLPVAELQKMDYLRSFQHLVTLPVSLAPEHDNLLRFGEDPLNADGSIRLPELSAVHDVLTPAACYHLYAMLQGTTVGDARYMTTRNTCFRREVEYKPLERQWSFSMRELVCVGDLPSVTGFLSGGRERVARFFQEIDLPITWETATDPFFNPTQSAKFVAQKLSPVKTEMIFDGRLAIGSVNLHHTHFGEAFDMRVDMETEAASGCIAFGIDRWIYAFTQRFGTDEKRWPLPPLQ